MTTDKFRDHKKELRRFLASGAVTHKYLIGVACDEYFKDLITDEQFYEMCRIIKSDMINKQLAKGNV